MKDYKKILEGVVNIINTTEKSDIGFANICTYISENCPELDESKDERIRKELIEGFKRYDDGVLFNGCLVRDIIAWLEKQGKKIEPIEGFNTEFERQVSHLIASSINKDYEYTSGYVKWVTDALLNYAKQEIKKQGEQKQVIIAKFKIGDKVRLKGSCGWYRVTDIRENAYYLTSHDVVPCLLPICEQDNWEAEQKPTDNDIKEALRTEYEKGRADAIAEMQKSAWSEVDEKMLNHIIANIESIKDEVVYCKTMCDEEINWLKSLKERVQPKLELTQLDKNILEAAIAFVKQNDHFNYWGGIDKRTVLSALRSLEPRYTWKPSDEQMQALSDAGNSFRPFEEGHKVLWSLYNDLKKLKGD